MKSGHCGYTLKKNSPTAYNSGMKHTRDESVRGRRSLPPVQSGRTQSWNLIGSFTRTKTAGGLKVLASVLVRWEIIEFGMRNVECGTAGSMDPTDSKSLISIVNLGQGFQ